MYQAIKLKQEKWKVDIANKVKIPRWLTLKQEQVNSVCLHIFGDATILAYCALAYLVFSHPSKVTPGLVGSKSRLSKKDITVPILELVGSNTYGSKSSYKYQNSSKRFRYQISDRMDRQYCCFTLVEGKGKLQSIRREQSFQESLEVRSSETESSRHRKLR